MNHTKTIEAIVERTLVDKGTCEQILGAYEKYGEKNITHMSKKHLPVITAEITEATGIEAKVVETVMTQFFDLLAEETKKKIPFMK